MARNDGMRRIERSYSCGFRTTGFHEKVAFVKADVA
jgi:hypothetical protein